MTTRTDEYSVIEPIAATVEFLGKTRELAPIKVGQLPKFARALKAIGPDSLAAMASADIAAMFDIVADHGENVIDAVSVASGIDRAEIEAADIDELVMLVAVVARINADFFARRLGPALNRAAEAAATSGGGQTRSKR